MFIALTLVGCGIALVIDVGHILAFAPLVALALTYLVDWLYRRRARQRIQAPPVATL
jgi:Flp pilus assembly protein TadB